MKMTSFSLKEVLRIPEQLLCYNTVKFMVQNHLYVFETLFSSMSLFGYDCPFSTTNLTDMDDYKHVSYRSQFFTLAFRF